MASIPVYTPGQVRRTPVMAPQQDAGALSVQARANQQLGQQVSALGDVADKHVERELELRAETAANAADSEVTAGWLEWDAAARKKYRGANVGEYAAEAKKWWDDASSTYGQNLDERAKRRVGPALQRKRTQAIGNVLQYSAAETERHADQTSAANIATTIQFGVTTGAVESAAAQVRTLVAQEGARKQGDTAEVQRRQVEQLSPLHLAQISKLAENDAAAASAYYNAAKEKGEIAFTYQAKAESVLKAETDNQFATQEAAKMANLPLEEQLSAAAKIGDPQRREKTITRIKEQVGLQNLANQAREKKFSDQAWQLVAQSKKVPETVLQAMDGKERVQLQDYQRQRAEHLAKGGDLKAIKTNDKAHRRLWALVSDDPEAFKKVRLEAEGMNLSASDYEQLAKTQANMKTPKGEKDIVSFNNKVAGRMEMLGIATGASGQEKRGQFRIAAQRLYEEAIERTGKPPAPADEEKLLDSLMLPGKTNWFGSKKAKTYAESVATGKPFQITGDDDYNKLPRGAKYLDPEGQPREKK